MEKSVTVVARLSVMSRICSEYENWLFERAMVKNLFLLKGFSKLLLQFLIVLVLGGALLGASCSDQQNTTSKQQGTTDKQQGTTPTVQTPNGSSIIINLSSRVGTSQFSTGVTRTHLDKGPETSAGHQLLGRAALVQNVFINGWGTDDPEPYQGQYNWTSLDARVNDIESSGSQPIITLCCASNWMKFTDNIEAAPLPQYYQSFAQLSAKVAARYPNVKIFQVWNELKGFNENAQAYTTLYNEVYDAVKAVRPDAEIGGPYLGVLAGLPADNQAVYTYWLNNKHGADSILIDGGPLLNGATDEFNTTFFSDWTNWLRKQPNGGATLPMAWSEFYTRGLADKSSLAANHYNATFADDTISAIKLGASYALMWGTSSPNGVTGDANIPETMMTDTGQPTPIFYSMQAFRDYFGPGTALYQATVYSKNVSVLAGPYKTMLVNHLPSNQTFNVNGTEVSLTPYQVLMINTPGAR